MLIAGSLSTEEGQLVAVDALVAPRDQGCDVELWIAGGPDLAQFHSSENLLEVLNGC
jgi:hypothetical protein